MVAEKLRSNSLEPGWRIERITAAVPLVAVRAAASVAPAWGVVGSRTLGRRAGVPTGRCCSKQAVSSFVTRRGEIVGALGVTGDVNDIDDLCAIDGIHAGGFRADGNFDPKAGRRLNIKRDPSLRDPARGRAGN
jgi:hypothetical protein